MISRAIGWLTLCAILIGATGAEAAGRNVYLASPLGFSEAGTRFKEQVLIPLLEKHGFKVLDPWKATRAAEFDAVAAIRDEERRKDAYAALDDRVGKRNECLIRAADVVLAVLDGVDVDSGTASEIGYAYALGKPIFGYRGDFRRASENEGTVVNLQVEHFIAASGGRVSTSVKALTKALDAMQRIASPSRKGAAPGRCL